METERLLIRNLREDDLDDYHRLLFADEEVCRHYSGRVSSLEESKEHLAYRIAEATYSDFQRWAVVQKEMQQFVGIIGLEAGVNSYYHIKGEPVPAFNAIEVELSFAFGRAYWGCGYAFEASETIIDYAFGELKLPQLLGGFAAENERSAKLHRRLGYEVHESADGDGYVALLINKNV